MWAHIPGLIVVVPSNPADAKALFKTALRAGDPVIFLEHKALFASKGDVPVGEHLLPFGLARVVRPGKDITIVSCGLYLHRCLEAGKILEEQGVQCEIIDLRTIVPLDVDTIAQSLAKTGRLLVVDEAYAMCGMGAEIAAAMMELAFDKIRAPIGRLHTETVTHPFSPSLDTATVVTTGKIIDAVQSVLAGRPPIPRRAKVSELESRRSADDGFAEKPKKLAHTVQGVNTPRSPASATYQGEPLLMPHGDLTVTDASVIRWLKRIGDSVSVGEAVVEVETDKAIFPVESQVNGRLVAILAEEGAIVALGQQLAVIQPD
jgi:2-oxoisovalerate dehydrogenase E1 component